ncbi:MAG TPA: hypothetical protein VNJ08_00900 [Bacteriovoracaceae bacterium]|nr:hypothetical protein [Bacteriovoracaceae bacterium]
MRFHALIAVFVVLTTLVGCGDDIPKKQTSKGIGKGVVIKVPAATADGELISSQMHRLRGINVLSYTEEIAQTLASTLPTTYKPIPDLLLDDEGTNTKNVITMTSVGRPTTACGTGGELTAGIDARIADCDAKNGTHAIWNGNLYGAAGESTWKLIAFTAGGKEIWHDLRTGMVWSDIVATSNWCKASGNKQTSTTTSAIDCSVTGEDLSFCSGANIEGLAGNVVWRLPTRNDYLQADINGLRFVMKPSILLGAWTATVQGASTEREHAWVYHITDGTLSAKEITSDRQVRCIGVPVR